MRDVRPVRLPRSVRLVIAAITFFIVVMGLELVVTSISGEAVNWTEKAILWGVTGVVVAIFHEWLYNRSIRSRRGVRDGAPERTS
jgi:hypothetical protein